jgi:hydrogenase nickel incorporation protein HypB
MGSPGSGKTSLLEVTLNEIKERYAVGVIEGDLATSLDAERLKKRGAEVLQINTGGMCHLDANLINKALDHFNLSKLDVLFVENIGNLVCPAFFDVGAHKNAVIVSLPEGDDKPIKYPVMFARTDIFVINKTDLAPYLEVNIGKMKSDARTINPKLEIMELSCKDRKGTEKWLEWIEKQIDSMPSH